MSEVKRETVGVDPKVPVQAIIAVLAFVLTYFGVDLSPELAAVIATVLGAIAGVLAPAAKTVAVSS